MAHTITHGGGEARVSGFLVSLPFTFDNGSNLELMPDNAMARLPIAGVTTAYKDQADNVTTVTPAPPVPPLTPPTPALISTKNLVE